MGGLLWRYGKTSPAYSLDDDEYSSLLLEMGVGVAAILGRL
jgi:hypothetical protein